MTRVLFLSASVGEGHRSAAGAVAAALDRIEPGARSEIVDSYQYAAAVVSKVVADGYLRMVKSVPQLYRSIYQRAEKATEIGPFRSWAHQFTAANLRPLIERERPDVVVCTHAFPSGAMAEYKRTYDPHLPVAGIVTDYAVHGFWMHEEIDAYFVASSAVRDAMVARGMEPTLVHDSGIPVREAFVANGESRTALRERLGLPQDRPLVLLMGGGLGIAPLERMLHALEAAPFPIAAVAIAGRSTRVARRALAVAETASFPVRMLPFVENVYDYMHAADVLVTKPGGLSAAEALVAAVPMVLCRPLPGQEERNARVLTANGAALAVRKLDQLSAAVGAIVTDRPIRERMLRAAAGMARPNAAIDAARAIVRLARLQPEVLV